MLRRNPGVLGGVAGGLSAVAGILAGLKQREQRKQDDEERNERLEYLREERAALRDRRERENRLAEAERLQKLAPFVALEQGPELASRAAQVATGKLAENPALRGMTPGQAHVANVGADLALRGLGDISGQHLQRPQTVGDLTSGLLFTRTPELTKKQEDESAWILDLLRKRLGEHPNAQIDLRSAYKGAVKGSAGGPDLLDLSNPQVRDLWGPSKDEIDHTQALRLQNLKGQTQAYVASLREALKRGDKTADRKIRLFTALMARGANVDVLPEYVDTLIDHFSDAEIQEAIGGLPAPGGEGQPAGAPPSPEVVPSAPGAATGNPVGFGVAPPSARPSLFAGLRAPAELTAPVAAPPMESPSVTVRPAAPAASAVFPKGTDVQQDQARKDRGEDRKDKGQLLQALSHYVGIVKSPAFDRMSREERQQLAAALKDITGALDLPVLPIAIDERFSAKELMEFGLRDRRLTLEEGKEEARRLKQEWDAKFRLWKERRDLPEGLRVQAETVGRRIMELSERIAWMQKEKRPDYAAINELGRHLVDLHNEMQRLTAGTDNAGAGPSSLNLPPAPKGKPVAPAPQLPSRSSTGAKLQEDPRYRLRAAVRSQPHMVRQGGKTYSTTIDEMIEGIRKYDPKLTLRQAEDAAQQFIRENRVVEPR